MIGKLIANIFENHARGRIRRFIPEIGIYPSRTILNYLNFSWKTSTKYCIKFAFRSTWLVSVAAASTDLRFDSKRTGRDVKSKMEFRETSGRWITFTSKLEKGSIECVPDSYFFLVIRVVAPHRVLHWTTFDETLSFIYFLFLHEWYSGNSSEKIVSRDTAVPSCVTQTVDSSVKGFTEGPDNDQRTYRD